MNIVLGQLCRKIQLNYCTGTMCFMQRVHVLNLCVMGATHVHIKLRDWKSNLICLDSMILVAYLTED